MEVEEPPPQPVQDYATLLWRTSTQIFLDHQDKILRTFTNSSFSNKTIIADIEKSLATGIPIGDKSGMGSNNLITVEGGKQYVVKTMEVCPDDIGPADVFKQSLCREANTGDIVFRVPSSYDDKQILLTPNYFSESLIGLLLSSKSIITHTPSFPKIYGFQYDSLNPNKKVYTVMEPLKPIIPLLNSEEAVLYYIFQISAALNTAQKLGRYTHYDLHPNNVLSRPKSGNVLRMYELNNGKYVYTLFDFDAVIIDFGMNRMETKNEIIIPKINFPPPIPQLPDAFNFYEFNPYYDLFTIIYFTLFIDNRVPMINNPNFAALREKLMSLFLGIKNDADTIYRHIDSIKISYWRPNPSAFGTYMQGGISPVTPENYMSLIASYIEKITFNDYGDANTLTDAQVAQILRHRKIIVLNKLFNFNGLSGIKGGTVHPLVPKKEEMSNIYYSIRLMDKTKMPYIRIDTKHEIIDNNSQYIHVATIDQRKGISEGGFKFRLDCCRVDIRNFFRTDKIKCGVAINGGFFRIKSDFMPVGYYKTPDMLSKNMIPALYKSHFGMVGIYKNGLLGLSREVSETNVKPYEQVLSVGPVLVWEDRIVVNEQYLNDVNDNIALFHCVKTPDGMDPQLKYFTAENGVNVPNCDKISPGELSHSSNPNPRSAVCVDSKTNLVYFVYVEGRNQRGVGMSVLELANVCKRLGATHAINLDGGGSSQLVWRSPGETVIGQTNPDHDFAYPVGNIISFVKER